MQLLAQENKRLAATAEAHAAALAKAREGFVPSSEMEAAVKELERRLAETTESLESAKAEAGSWERKAKEAEEQARKDRAASDGVIQGWAKKYADLEAAVLDKCREILDLLGFTEDVMKPGTLECLRAVVDAARDSTMGVRAVLRHISPTEVLPSSFRIVSEYLAKLPTVFDWMQRSAFHRGATTALSMGLAHFPDDFILDEVTRGFPSETGSVMIEEVQKWNSLAAPFADRVLAVGDLTPYQASRAAPGDEVPEQRDFAVERPFEAAHEGKLTNFVVNPWVPTQMLRREDESSSPEVKE